MKWFKWFASLRWRVFAPLIVANIAVCFAVLFVDILHDAAVDVSARNKQVKRDLTRMERYTTEREAIIYAMAISSFYEWSPEIPILVELWTRDNHRLYINQKKIHFKYAPLVGDPNKVIQIIANGEPYNLIRHDGSRWSLRIAIPKSPQSPQELWQEYTHKPPFQYHLFLACPVLALFLWLAIIRGLAPLRSLSQTLTRRTANDLSLLNFDAHYAELKPVVEALDSLLLRLQKKMQREQSFIQEAGQKLRAPMAEIESLVQKLIMAARQPSNETNNPSAKHLLEQRISTAIANTSGVIQQLLEMAQMDGMAAQGSEALDCAQWVRNDLAQRVSALLAQQIDISMEAPQSLVVSLNRSMFQLIWHNLLDIATTSVIGGGEIAIGLRLENAQLILTVADDGAGMVPVQDDDFAVAGLSLAIVQRLANRIGAAFAQSSGLHGRGCQFTVSIPMQIA